MRVIWMLLLMLAVTSPAFAQNRPNVVIMLADNVGYGDPGAYGAGEVRGMPTPRIDSIAGQGLRLTQFLVEPGCTLSRAALMTGRHSVRSGLSTIIIGALEGSIRTVCMIKWPGKIESRASNEMVSIHDIFPTLAGIIGGKLPTDRPMDDVDQSAFLTGKQPKSNRESLITFIGEEVAAVRWQSYRIYPKQFVMSAGNPSMGGIMGYRQEGAGDPAIFNIEQDQREESNLRSTDAWVIGQYMRLIAEYLEKYPNPKAVNLTQFGRGLP